jgi:hypothetical protein
MDCNSRLNFPSRHPLNLSMAPKECYEGADVVLALDVADFEKPTHVRDIAEAWFAMAAAFSSVPPFLR